MSRDIAVVGVAVEVADATDMHGFWEIIREGRSLVRPFPVDRRHNVVEYVKYLRASTVYGEPDDPVVYHDGCFMDRVDLFEAEFFGMTPKQASTADPHQRMIMRTMYHAMEDAGYTGPRRHRLRTGVFVGYAGNPSQSYLDYYIRIDPSLGRVGLTGNVTTMMANRISHHLDLHGPSMVVDSACSASLVAVHQARNALLVGDCEMAVVAGARVVAGPVKHPTSAIGIESSDGFTRTFDDRADGTGFGEGSGAVVLKLLDRAEADGDQIYAVIKGSAVNHDGATEGITTPDSDAQADLLQRAWANAGVDPRSIGYIEVHGTATRIGDPTEFEGLRRAFAGYTTDQKFCAIGTVKANIGHLYESSGVLGFIKAVLVLRNATIPRQAVFELPNRSIDFDNAPAYVPTATTPWQAGDTPRRAGVSAFGLGGTNCHVVLEEYQGRPARLAAGAGSELFCLSARTERSLRAMVASYARHLAGSRAEQLRLSDVCYTAAVSRGQHRQRLALVATSVADLAARLAALAAGEPAVGEVYSSLGDWNTAGEPDAGGGASAGAAGVALAGLGAVAARYAAGGELDPATLWAGRDTRIVWLPGYVFDERRCWIDFPEDWRKRFFTRGAPIPSTPESPMTYSITFEPVAAPPAAAQEGRVLALVDPQTGAEQMLTAAGLGDLRILRLARAHAAEPEADGFRLDEAGITALTTLISGGEYTHVVFALAFEATAASDADELQRRVHKNLFGLFLLLKALMRDGAQANFVVLTRSAIALRDGDAAVAPENAALVGLAKSANREYPGLAVKVVDVDETVPPQQLRAEILERGQGPYVLRDGERHRERFADLPVVEPAGDGPYLRSDGVYLVTGGTRGIGLATADMFSRERPDITLVLLSRSGLPAAEHWAEILANEPAGRRADSLRTLQECVGRGSKVDVRQVDVGDVAALTAALVDIQHRYGRIDGIVHAAGIPGDRVIANRELADFEAVVRPKMFGAFVLDELTRHDPPDFVVHFSSVAAIFPAGGQGDYAAANYYLDNLARANVDKRCHVLAVDWAAWQEIGMAVDTQTNVDTSFKTIATATGLSLLDAALRSAQTRLFVGEMNYENYIVGVLGTYDVVLDDGIVARIAAGAQAREERRHQQAERTRRLIREVEVELKGRPDGGYSALETLLGHCWAHAFGYPQIDVTADFFDLGGDSIMAISLVGSVSACLDIEVSAGDLLLERTIEGLAQVLEMTYGLSPDLDTVDW